MPILQGRDEGNYVYSEREKKKRKHRLGISYDYLFTTKANRISNRSRNMVQKQEISDFQRMNQSEYAPHTTKRMHESEFVFY